MFNYFFHKKVPKKGRHKFHRGRTLPVPQRLVSTDVYLSTKAAWGQRFYRRVGSRSKMEVSRPCARSCGDGARIRGPASGTPLSPRIVHAYCACMQYCACILCMHMHAYYACMHIMHACILCMRIVLVGCAPQDPPPRMFK